VQDEHAAFSGMAILAVLSYHATKEFNAFEVVPSSAGTSGG